MIFTLIFPTAKFCLALRRCLLENPWDWGDLSPEESNRFQRAIYRIWIYALKFRKIVGEEATEKNSEAQKQFLSQYKTYELFDIKRASYFLRLVLQATRRRFRAESQSEDTL